MVAKLYRYFISPFLHTLTGPGFGCRFEPTCSHYAEEAFSVHSTWRATVLAVSRVLRCNPWSRGGIDPVPPRTHSNPR